MIEDLPHAYIPWVVLLRPVCVRLNLAFVHFNVNNFFCAYCAAAVDSAAIIII